MRFTIRSLMIAVAIVALLMVLPGGWMICAGVVGFFWLAFTAAAWVEFRDLRRLAALGFWVPAVLVNVLYTAAGLTPSVYTTMPLFLGWLFLLAPTIGRMGVAWARLATWERAAPRRSPVAVWSAVIGLTVLPALDVLTLCPLHLAFALARPTMDRLADQVVAGQSVVLPRWAGPFRLVRAVVYPVSGHVGLMIDPNPSGPTGFVRARPDAPQGGRDPILGTDLYVELGGGWSYREED